MIIASHEPAPNDVSIRCANETDAVQLAKLRYTFRSVSCRAGELEGSFVERCQLWMWERLRHPSSWRCWIAESNSTLVGNLWVKLIDKIPNPSDEPERHAYLTNFCVREGYRGLGVGSRLLTTALEWIQNQNIHLVVVWRTEQSREFYVRNGFAVQEYLMERLIASCEADRATN